MCGFHTEPYQVGQFYRVPSVYARFYCHIGWWPVMGDAHRDTEIIGFSELHYHVDWRFVSEPVYRRFIERGWRGPEVEAHFVPLMLTPEKGPRPRRIGDPGAFAELQRRTRRLKCKRQLPPYPHHSARWHGPLSAAHANSCLKRGVCPHRGYDLSREPVVDGVVTCPLHGLRWNVQTGAAVPPPPPPVPEPFAPCASAAEA